jgi:hypothetical protein
LFLFQKNDKAQTHIRTHTHTHTLSRVRQAYNQDGGWIVKIFYCITERLVYIGREGISEVEFIIKKKEIVLIFFLNTYSNGDFVLNPFVFVFV